MNEDEQFYIGSLSEVTKLFLDSVEKRIDNTDILNKYNIKDYKFKHLYNLEKYIKKCARCNKLFFPRLETLSSQIYCSDDCRYNSTREYRKRVVLPDKKYKQIDMLRKTIYERKYRSRKEDVKLADNIENEFNLILDNLCVLVKDRHTISDNEFTMRLKEERLRYNKCVKK